MQQIRPLNRGCACVRVCVCSEYCCVLSLLIKPNFNELSLCITFISTFTQSIHTVYSSNSMKTIMWWLDWKGVVYLFVCVLCMCVHACFCGFLSASAWVFLHCVCLCVNLCTCKCVCSYICMNRYSIIYVSKSVIVSARTCVRVCVCVCVCVQMYCSEPWRCTKMPQQLTLSFLFRLKPSIVISITQSLFMLTSFPSCSNTAAECTD